MSIPHIRTVFVLFLTLSASIACGGSHQPASAAPAVASADAERKIDPRASVALIDYRPARDIRILLIRLGIDQNLPLDTALRDMIFSSAVDEGSGSGFVVAERRGELSDLLVTNHHVIDRNAHPLISFDEGSTLHRGTVIYVDDFRDLALVRIPIKRPGLALADVYADGQRISALGYPADNGVKFRSKSVTIADACIEEKELLSFGGSNRCFISFSTSLGAGSSGGPLLTSDQHVVGVQWRTEEDATLGYAIPAESVSQMLARSAVAQARRLDPPWMITKLKEACWSFMREITAKDADGYLLINMLSDTLAVREGMPSIYHEGLPLFDHPSSVSALTLIDGAIVKFIWRIFRRYMDHPRPNYCDHILNESDVTTKNAVIGITHKLSASAYADTGWAFEYGRWVLYDFGAPYEHDPLMGKRSLPISEPAHLDDGEEELE